MTTTEDSTTGTEDSTPVVTWADRYVPADDAAAFHRLRGEYDTLVARVNELIAERDNAVATAESAQGRFSDVSTERNQLQDQLEQARRRRDQVSEQFEHFKEQVVEVADRYARQHNLCSVIDEALEEVGLERPRLRYRGEITFIVSFETGLTDRSRGLPDNSWVETSIQTGEVMDAIRDSFEMDSDHEDTAISDISYRVRNVQEVE